MPNHHIGELAALITALLWALTSIVFTLAGQHVGARIVNRARLLLAVLMMSLYHFVVEGTFLPLDTAPERWVWLGASAIVGLVIGDSLLFYAFTLIGARLSMLLMALNPLIGALMAWGLLGETLSPVDLIAIAVTLGGVGWVVMERANGNGQAAASKEENHHYFIGVLSGLGAATGQAAGLVLSKQGMVGDFPAASASLMRIFAATIAIWIGAALQGHARPSLAALRDRRTGLYIGIGALGGPVLGMTLSLVAVQFSEVGIVSTLMALSPVFLLPLSHWLFKEKITLRAVLGTVVAMIGVAMIFIL